MAAPRQKLMKERATVVATTTFAVVEPGLLMSGDIRGARRHAPFYVNHVFYLTMITWTQG